LSQIVDHFVAAVLALTYWKHINPGANKRIVIEGKNSHMQRLKDRYLPDS